MNNLVDINLYGILSNQIGRKNWKLAVKSVSEALHAIETISKRKFFKTLHDNDKKGIKYRVLINQRDFMSESELNIEKPETVIKSELTMEIENLRTIDIVPVLECADADIGTIILGALLIIVGIVIGVTFGWTGVGGAFAAGFIIGGLGLVAAGVINLLSKPPSFEDFREIGGGKNSYLFGGPENVTREGGPVPVGYGRLLVGSQVISATYEISNRNAALNELTA